VISTEKMLIALPRCHPLSGTPTVALSALAGETLVIFPRDVSPSLYELIVTACLRAGFSRHTFQQAPQITTSLGMVAAGCGIALVPESMRCVDNPGVSFCDIENNTLFTDVAFAWRRLHPSKAVLHLLALLAEQPAAPGEAG
ncbi:MAG TPA: transcriptional regulator, partial [Pantoea agglomerans]|nr:transcriptional regulator [Pantoea agglomerans]